MLRSKFSKAHTARNVRQWIKDIRVVWSICYAVEIFGRV